MSAKHELMMDWTEERWSSGNIAEDPAAILNLLDAIPAQIAYVDFNMSVRYCNHLFRSLFSIADTGTGFSFPLAVGKDIFGQIQRYMGKVLVGKPAHFQAMNVSIHGIQYLDVTLSPHFKAGKQMDGFVFHSFDVTEKNRTERDLKDYFENASIGLHWVDAGGIIIWANPAELKMLGYSYSEYVGHHISKFHRDKNVIADILTSLGNRQTLRNCEAALVCKDGSTRDVSINSSVLFEGDKFIHTRCFTVDVTEQKLAAKAVRESEQAFRTMASLVQFVIWTTDETGASNFLNRRWEEFTGKSVEEALCGLWTDFIHPDDRTNIISSWLRCFSGKKSFEGKFRFLNVKHGYAATYVSASPQCDASGAFKGYIGILQDISAEEQIKHSLEKIVLERMADLRRRNVELRSAEKALLEKNRELERINAQLSSFAHIASHDLQEPLRKIQLYSGRLFELEGRKFSDQANDFHRRIEDSSERMRNLIQNLLSYSKTSTNDAAFESVDLDLLLEEAVGELEVKISESKARIENLGLPKLNVVRFQFVQLFMNLLNNALKFSSPDRVPHIVIKAEIVGSEDLTTRTGPARNYHHISVADNGIGFDQQNADSIFEMFHRLHHRSQYEGTGLGLAICKKIIDNHNGAIRAEGVPGAGATFHIYLPASQEEKSN